MERVNKEQILTHRGLEPSNPNFFSESTFEAFENHLTRGYSIEFDANLTMDGIVIAHDATASRITNGKDSRSFRNMSTAEALKIRLEKGRIARLEEVLGLIANNLPGYNALHLKDRHQSEQDLNKIIEVLRKFPLALDKIIIFDLKIKAAEYIKKQLPEVALTATVAHPFDIARYGNAVGNTMISVDEILETGNLYDWACMDEWDLADEGGGNKKLYTKENIQRLRDSGFKIAVVSPELHGSSPGLLGGENHPDASLDRLYERVREIIALEPDIICTDYPNEVYELLLDLEETYCL